MSGSTTQDEVIDALREGRVTPHHLLDVTSIDSKQTAQYHLRELRAQDRVERISRGLYELADNDEDPNHETDDGEAVFKALIAALEDDDVDAFSRVDTDAFEFGDRAGDRE